MATLTSDSVGTASVDCFRGTSKFLSLSISRNDRTSSSSLQFQGIVNTQLTTGSEQGESCVRDQTAVELALREFTQVREKQGVVLLRPLVLHDVSLSSVPSLKFSS